MSDNLDPSLKGLTDCGCCSGITEETPASRTNREGLDRIPYRVGTFSSFKRTMLAALSESRYPTLTGLTTRADDDFTIALLDAWAVSLDILTFYQERLANEAYLRTATDRGSVLRLARLIGYEPKPGVAASAFLTFILETVPGAPAKAAIATGTKVQSVPGQDEKPQTFETVEDLQARAEWNAMVPIQVEESPVLRGAKTSEQIREMYLKGTGTQLAPGDAILIIGDERDQNPNVPGVRERWDLRILTSVTLDPIHDRTHVGWQQGLGEAPIEPAAKNVQVYAMRARAALFGHNAPDPNLLSVKPSLAGFLFDLDFKKSRQWKNFGVVAGTIDLDSAYSKIAAGSWVALKAPPDASHPRGYVELYKALKVSFPSVAQFALSGKITRIVPDTSDNMTLFDRRETIVYAQSELLQVDLPPLTTRLVDAPSLGINLDLETLAPVEGTHIIVDRQVTGLPKRAFAIVSGKRSRVKVALAAPSLGLADDSGSNSRVLKPGDSLVAVQPPALQPSGKVKWRLRHDDGFEATLLTGAADLVLTVSARNDPVVSEVVVIDSSEGNPTQLVLGGTGLANIYDRGSVAIAGNVAHATHGETVEEIAGSGDASQVFQKFALRQGPLTYLRSADSSDLTSTLAVRIDALLWKRASSFFQKKATERIYVERQVDEQSTAVLFGDGVNGARLPSGQQNVRLKYRKGSGLDGMVQANQLTQLLTRPLGVREVTNPLPAEGADEPEALSDARMNAPLTVLTMKRVVSLQDYEDFARAYPGIAKARATWMWDGRKRGVFLTVAGPHGASISAGPGSTGEALLEAMHSSGDPFVPLRLEGFRPAWFNVAGVLTIDPDYEKDRVLQDARSQLRFDFSFEQRELGQPVVLSEVFSVLQKIKGVVAVDLEHFQRTDTTASDDPAPRLLAESPLAGSSAQIKGAELLLLAPGNLQEIKAAS